MVEPTHPFARNLPTYVTGIRLGFLNLPSYYERRLISTIHPPKQHRPKPDKGGTNGNMENRNLQG